MQFNELIKIDFFNLIYTYIKLIMSDTITLTINDIPDYLLDSDSELIKNID